jgi:hypothetical protein
MGRAGFNRYWLLTASRAACTRHRWLLIPFVC